MEFSYRKTLILAGGFKIEVFSQKGDKYVASFYDDTAFGFFAQGVMTIKGNSLFDLDRMEYVGGTLDQLVP
jgi:hypothetical protein